MVEENKEKGLEQILADYSLWNQANKEFEKVEYRPDFRARLAQEVTLKRKKEENLTDEQSAKTEAELKTAYANALTPDFFRQYQTVGKDLIKTSSEDLVKKVESENIIGKLDEKILSSLILQLIEPKVKDGKYAKLAEAHKNYLEIRAIQESKDDNAKYDYARKFHEKVYGSKNLTPKEEYIPFSYNYLNAVYQILARRADSELAEQLKDKDIAIGYIKENLKDAKIEDKADVYSKIANVYFNSEKAKDKAKEKAD